MRVNHTNSGTRHGQFWGGKSRRAGFRSCELLLLGLLVSSQTGRVAGACLTCPQNATDAVIGGGFDVHVTRGGIDRALGAGARVGSCETIRLESIVHYDAVGSSGGVGAGFTGGTGVLYIIARGSQTGLREFLGDVTPSDMAQTFVTVTNPLVNPNLCIPPAGTVAVEAKGMLTQFYTLTPADIEAGSLQFEFDYTGTALLQDPVTGDCPNRLGGTTQTHIHIMPPPAAIVSPATNSLCAGSLAGFTASIDPNTNGPYTFRWTGPNGFTSGPRINNTGSDSISLESAQAANAGVYVGTVQDAFGCTVTFSGTLIIGSTAAGIAATVACSSDAVQPGQTINLTGMVTNTGVVTLTDVTLFDSLSGGQIAHFDTLAPGAAQFYQNNYLATAANCGNTLTENFIAVGLDACGNSISNTASCSFQVRCPPRISSVTLAGSDLILSGSGGMSNGAYAVVTTTNAGAPMATWIQLGTNHFDANGQFALTNHINSNENKRYYRLLLR